jgi:hypothetical protein
MKDDCYVLINERTGTRWEVVVKAGEMWLDLSMLPPDRQKEALESGEGHYGRTQRQHCLRSRLFLRTDLA